jgi:hypothetical protein
MVCYGIISSLFRNFMNTKLYFLRLSMVCSAFTPSSPLGLKVWNENFRFRIFAKISRKFIFAKFDAKIFAKTKISTNTYTKIFLFGIIIFWPDFFTIFWQKFSLQFLQKLKLMQKCSQISRNEISRKLPHLRMVFDFRKNEKKPFSFQPYSPPLSQLRLSHEILRYDFFVSIDRV